MYSHTALSGPHLRTYGQNHSRRRLYRRSLQVMLFCCVFVLLNLLRVWAAEPETQSYVSIADEHGPLHVSPEGKLLDQNNDVFQLRGVSTHNLAWYPESVSRDMLSGLRDEFDINTVRFAVYPTESGGYCSQDPAAAQALLETVSAGIEHAVDLGLYVILDWHILSDSNPLTYRQEALSFFEKIAASFGSCPNVIYEICNEPGDSVSWEELRSYYVDLIDCIRYYAPESLIIVGTPSWCQDVEAPLRSPVPRDNLLYSLHIFAASQNDELMLKIDSAAQSGLPMIVSQFGAADGSGTASVDTQSADRWISMFDYYDMGYICWNASNHEDTNALFVPSCSVSQGWSPDDYSAAGQWFRQLQNGPRPEGYMPFSRSVPCTTLTASDDHWVFSNGSEVSVTADQSWSADSVEYISYNITLTNNSSSPLSGWRLLFTWSNPVELKEYWSCDVGGSDHYRFLVPAEYNSVVPSGTSISFGIVAYGAQQPLLTCVSYE